jgi:hypothetical protein
MPPPTQNALDPVGVYCLDSLGHVAASWNPEALHPIIGETQIPSAMVI